MEVVLGIDNVVFISILTGKLPQEQQPIARRVGLSLALVLVQILALDVVFSLDSVITAVGMAQHVAVMVVAMIVAVGVMLAFAGRIGDFVNRHPTDSTSARATSTSPWRSRWASR